MGRIVKLLLLVPLAVIVLIVAMANRSPTVISLDPLSPANPMLSVTVPLFVPIFVTLILGIVLGGAGTWLRQGRARRTARRLRVEAARLQSDLARSRARQADAPSGTAIALRGGAST